MLATAEGERSACLLLLLLLLTLGFNVSSCQAAACHTLSSHSIIRPGPPDGVSYTLPGTTESTELWDDV